MLYVDANIILRYILCDNDELAESAKAIVDASTIFITTEVLAEVVYVLSSVYNYTREETKDALITFIDDSSCGLINHEVVVKSLEIYSDTVFDFVDCILAAYATVGGAKVATFDRKLQDYIESALEEVTDKA